VVQYVLTTSTSVFICVCGSGREVADVHQQHVTKCSQHRHPYSAHCRHVAVVPVNISGCWCSVHVSVRDVSCQHPASAALPAGINGAAVDARRRQCPRTEQRPRLPTSRRLSAEASSCVLKSLYIHINPVAPIEA